MCVQGVFIIAFVMFVIQEITLSALTLTKHEGVDCVCVPQHICFDNNVAALGEGLLDIRHLERANVLNVLVMQSPNAYGDKPDEFHAKGIDEFKPSVKVFLDYTRVASISCENYYEICCNLPKEETLSKPEKIDDFKPCGYKNPFEMGYRITTDSQTAMFAEFPWAIAVLYMDELNSDRIMYKCGGSLIHPQVALTAAHCVFGFEAGVWSIRAGEWNTVAEDELLPHQDRLVEDIVIHQNYQDGSLKNDIALLFLNSPIDPAENVGFICLPPHETILLNLRCIASGWGRDGFKNGKHSTVLKKIELPLVDREVCVQSLRATRLGTFYNLHRSFICAGGEKNRDTCKGDGGSPLVCPIPGGQVNRFVQLGIVSWGIGCGESNTPGVYTNVALYRDWVDKELGVRSFDTSLYRYE